MVDETDEDETNPAMVAQQPLPQQTITSGPGGELPQQGGPTSPQSDTNNQANPPIKDIPDSELIKAAQKNPVFAKFDDDQIQTGIDEIKKQMPGITNIALIPLIPQIAQEMQTPQFQNLVVQNHIRQNMSKNADNATAPVAPTTNQSNGGAGINPYYAAQANAEARYPDAAEATMKQGQQLQQAALAGQQQQFNQGTAANDQGQKNVQFAQAQQVQQAAQDVNSPLNQAWHSSMKAINPSLNWDSVPLSQAGPLGQQFIENYYKQYQMSGLPTINQDYAHQAASVNPANLDTARIAVNQSLVDFKSGLSALPPDSDKRGIATAALQLYQADPGSKEAIAAEDTLNALHAGGIITALHGLTSANNLLNSSSGGKTDFGIQQGIRDAFATNNLDALNQSIQRTASNIDAGITQAKNLKTNTFNNRGIATNQTMPNESIRNPNIKTDISSPEVKKETNSKTTMMYDPKNPSIVRTIQGDRNSALVKKYLTEGKRIVGE